MVFTRLLLLASRGPQRKIVTLDYYSLQVHAETDPTVEGGTASNGGATTVEGGTASNGGATTVEGGTASNEEATSLNKHDGQGNGGKMDASAHQSGRMSDKKTVCT